MKQRSSQLNFSGGVVTSVHQRRSTEPFYRVSVADSVNLRPTEHGSLRARKFSQRIGDLDKIISSDNELLSSGRLLNDFYYVSPTHREETDAPFDKRLQTVPAVHAILNQKATAVQIDPESTPYPDRGQRQLRSRIISRWQWRTESFFHPSSRPR